MSLPIVRPGRLAILLTLALATGLVIGGCRPTSTSLAYDGSGLRTIEAGTGALPFVLIHGYGSSATEWIPFTYTIRLPAGRRFVLPEGPEATRPPDGPRNGRAWWRLDLDAHRPPGEGSPIYRGPTRLVSPRRTSGSARCSPNWPPRGAIPASSRCSPATRRAG
jgi:hypothetical protein